jgi:hypothetical protein
MTVSVSFWLVLPDYFSSFNGAQSPGASRSWPKMPWDRSSQQCRGAMKGQFERSRLLEQKAHAFSVHGSLGPKNACNKLAHTKRSGVFEILLHECELMI